MSFTKRVFFQKAEHRRISRLVNNLLALMGVICAMGKGIWMENCLCAMNCLSRTKPEPWVSCQALRQGTARQSWQMLLAHRV